MEKKLNLKDFLNDVLENPGKIHECFKYFKNYSLKNQAWASMQLHPNLEPINTYRGWQELGRQVKKGAKAIELMMPVQIKDTESDDPKAKKTIFIYKKNWFKLSDTNGDEFKQIDPVENFDFKKCLENLKIEQIEFNDVNGNCQGYAIPKKQKIAINKLAVNPLKTGFHEVAHCLLHSDEVLLGDSLELSKSIKEFEAEGVAYIISARLNLGGLEYSRGYIQDWLKHGDTKEITEKNLNRILTACEKILKAGNIN
jgi:hypothetical protein